ncbi:MAG: TRAP transporter substrate-binding protein [Alphaproteobacteria bacterium]|nr:TRAP transporter substrate-binding protein [Alphaproteobacteria bacterium]
MKRRSFLGKAVAAGVAAAAFPRPAIAQGKMEWRMVTAWPRGLPGLGTGTERLAKRIGDLSGGRLTVKLYAAGELVPALQCFDAVASGTAEMGHDASYYHIGKSRAMPFFTTVPFGMTAAEHNAWIAFGGGQELWDELYAPFGVKPFPGGNTGVQMGGWFRKEINSVEDFKGLKFRMPGQGGEILKKLGANIVLLPAGEIFAALQSGAIDGTEWVGPHNDMALGLYKVAPNYYFPGFHEPGAALELMVNKQQFDALPADLKAIVQAAAQAENDLMLSELNARNGAALESLITIHGVRLRQFSRDILTALGQASGEIIAELLASDDPMTKKIAQAYVKARTNLVEWTKVGEQAYTNARLLKFDYPR